MARSFDTPEQAARRAELVAAAQATIAASAGGPSAAAMARLDELLEGLTGEERRLVAGTAFFDAADRLQVRRLRPVPPVAPRDHSAES